MSNRKFLQERDNIMGKCTFTHTNIHISNSLSVIFIPYAKISSSPEKHNVFSVKVGGESGEAMCLNNHGNNIFQR